MMDANSRDACLKEVKILQNVEHPNIVKCFKYFIQVRCLPCRGPTHAACSKDAPPPRRLDAPHHLACGAPRSACSLCIPVTAMGHPLAMRCSPGHCHPMRWASTLTHCHPQLPPPHVVILHMAVLFPRAPRLGRTMSW